FAKVHLKTILVFTLVFGLGIYFWYGHIHKTQAKTQYVTQAANKTTITVSVSATGQVAASDQVDLKPGSSGNLTAINVKAGDTVTSGQVIAVVDESANNVAITQARASVMTAQANYDKLVGGLTGSDLETAQNPVSDAQAALDKANRDYDST